MNSKRLFFSRKGIRAYSIAAFICIGVLPFLMVGVYLSWHSFSIQKKQIIEQQNAVTSIAAQSMSSFFHEQKHLVAIYIKTNFQMDMKKKNIEAKLREFLAVAWDKQHSFVFSAAYLLDAQGDQLSHVSRIKITTQTELHNLSESEEFSVPFKKKSGYFSPVYFDQILMEPVMKLALPMRDMKTGQPIGVFVAVMKFRPIWNVIAQLDIGDYRVAYVIDEDGTIVAHKNPSVVLSNSQLPLWNKVGVVVKAGGHEVIQTVERIEYDGHPLYMVIESPTDTAYAHIYREFIAVAIFFAIALCCAIIVGLFVLRKIVLPIEEMSATALKISKGDYAKRAKYKHDDELGDLGRSFNLMTDNLVGSIKRIEHEKAFIQSAIESLTHPFIVRDAKDYTVALENTAAQMRKAEKDVRCYVLSNGTDELSVDAGIHYPINEVIKTKRPIMIEQVCRKESGITKYYEVNAYPIFDRENSIVQVIEYIIDVTEKKVLESQLRQAKKLEALGSLAGGVAHDFNNLLTGVIGYAELTLKKLPADSSLRDGVELILESGERGAELTGQLLTFSRNSALESKAIRVAEIIDNNRKIIKGMLGEGVKLEVNVASDIWNIKADAKQIDQLLVNLSLNARDAMRNHGVLSMNISNIVLTEDAARFYDDLSAGHYVKIVVEDTGVGMSSEVLEHIFEPFFTTKKQYGTGLGMAIVYGVVKQHGGSIKIESEEEKGTRILLLFPATEEAVEEKINTEANSLLKGDESVLVVDEDLSVLHLINDVLMEYGYIVHTALSSNEALDICSNLDGRVDLLLTDVVVSEMPGRELIDKIKQKYPSVKTMFMSGYQDDVLANYKIIKGRDALISKPIRVESILSSIRSVLDN